MTEGAKGSSAKSNLAALRQLFGPPPVLSSESDQSYDEIMSRFMQDFALRDFMEQTLVKELTDCTWEIARYTRHKALLMDRRFRRRLDFQAQRHKDAAQGEDALANGRAKQHRPPATEPEDVLDGLVEEVDAILIKPAAELNHLLALEVGLAHYEHLDRLLVTATARRDNVIDQIERYRHKLDQRLRLVSDQIIEGECNEF
jgi:hypothetical protein